MVASWRRFALIAAGGLVALETIVRFIAVPRSGDLARLPEYPAAANSLHACSTTRVALLGNSAAEVGVDLTLLQRELDSLGAGVACLSAFLADGAGMTTWRAMLRHYFWTPGNDADLFVIIASSGNLADELSPDAGRLARYLTSGAEWTSAMGTDSLSYGVRADMLLSSASAVIAVRHRIGKRMRPLVRAMGNTPPAREDTPTFQALGQVLARLQASGGTVLVVIFPVRGSSPLDPQVRARITGSGATLAESLSVVSSDYVDDWHVTTAGRAEFTRKLAPVIASAVTAPSR